MNDVSNISEENFSTLNEGEGNVPIIWNAPYY